MTVDLEAIAQRAAFRAGEFSASALAVASPDLFETPGQIVPMKEAERDELVRLARIGQQVEEITSEHIAGQILDRLDHITFAEGCGPGQAGRQT